MGGVGSNTFRDDFAPKKAGQAGDFDRGANFHAVGGFYQLMHIIHARKRKAGHIRKAAIYRHFGQFKFQIGSAFGLKFEKTTRLERALHLRAFDIVQPLRPAVDVRPHSVNLCRV